MGKKNEKQGFFWFFKSKCVQEDIEKYWQLKTFFNLLVKKKVLSQKKPKKKDPNEA